MEGERIMKCVLRGTLNKDLPLEIKVYKLYPAYIFIIDINLGISSSSFSR